MIVDSPLMAREYIENRFEWVTATRTVTDEDYYGNKEEKEEHYLYLHAKVLFHNNHEYENSIMSSTSSDMLMYEYLTDAYRTTGAVIGVLGIALFTIPLFLSLKKEYYYVVERKD